MIRTVEVGSCFVSCRTNRTDSYNSYNYYSELKMVNKMFFIMKKINNRWLAAAMCAAAMCLGGQSAQAYGPETIADKVFIEDFSIAPGESRIVPLWLSNNELAWDALLCSLTLPEGLTLEPMTDDDFDPEIFTTETVNSSDGKCYAVLSNEFGNAEYLIDGVAALEYAKKFGCSFPVFDTYFGPVDSNISLQITSYGMYQFNCTLPIVLVKLHADERLSDESSIVFNATIFEGYRIAQGDTEKTRVNGTPTVAHVRRVDPQPEMNCDVNGDGVIDIDDVNAVVNAVLKK